MGQSTDADGAGDAESHLLDAAMVPPRRRFERWLD
jgi:hypothetical protein